MQLQVTSEMPPKIIEASAMLSECFFCSILT